MVHITFYKVHYDGSIVVSIPGFLVQKILCAFRLVICKHGTPLYDVSVSEIIAGMQLFAVYLRYICYSKSH